MKNSLEKPNKKKILSNSKQKSLENLQQNYSFLASNNARTIYDKSISIYDRPLNLLNSLKLRENSYMNKNKE